MSIFLTLLVLSGALQAAPQGGALYVSTGLFAMQSQQGDGTGGAGSSGVAPTPTEAVQDVAEGNTDLNRDPVDPSTLEFSIQGNTVVATSGGSPVWQLPFPDGSGETRGFLEAEGGLYVGHGNSVLQVDPETGTVEARWLVSGQVDSIDRVNENTVSMTVEHAPGLSERFTLRQGGLQTPVRFGLDPQTYTYLRQEAQVENPTARLEQDPTNPWLYLAAGLQESDPNASQALLTQGVEVAQSFYDLAGLAQVLEENGERTLAEEAFERAMEDFAARGYDPRLLASEELQRAYNFPLEPFQEAVESENVISANFWAERLLLAAPYVPGASNAFLSYADLIEDEVSLEQVSYWRDQSRNTLTTSGGGLDNLAGSLGNIGWYAALAVFIAILLLHLTLLFKYWIPQTGDIQKRREEGGQREWLARLLVPRYYTITEKLVLALMFLVIVALVGLASWFDRGAGLPPATQSGTLANREALAYLERAELTGVQGAFIQGYASQVAGESRDAEVFYTSAETYAPALNNLGALTGDSGRFEEALSLASNLPEARYNLRQSQNAQPVFLFQDRYRSDQALLAAPTQEDFRNAVSGTWDEALGSAFVRPWASLPAARPATLLPGLNPVLWAVILILFFLIFLFNVAFLFVPRAKSGRNAPRTLAYQVLAVLVPGSGLADEAWGLFLIVPWAIVALDVAAQLAGWGIDIGFSARTDYIVLGVIYLVNLVSFIVEYGSYRNRMKALKAEQARAARPPQKQTQSG